MQDHPIQPFSERAERVHTRLVITEELLHNLAVTTPWRRGDVGLKTLITDDLILAAATVTQARLLLERALREVGIIEDDDNKGDTQ